MSAPASCARLGLVAQVAQLARLGEGGEAMPPWYCLQPARHNDRHGHRASNVPVAQAARHPPAADVGPSTTLLGDWYATVLPWRPRQVALFVNEKTLLPVVMPLAPATSLLDRFPEHLAHVLARHHVDEMTVAGECIDTTDYQVGTTASRRAVGSINEFSFLVDAYRQDDPELDLLDLSIRLSRVPCGPLYRRHVSPDRELHALLNDT